MIESPVKAGPFCEHGVRATFPCSKCRTPNKSAAKLPMWLLLAVAVTLLLGAAELISGWLGT